MKETADLQRLLTELEACTEARHWASWSGHDAGSAWAVCRNVRSLLWILTRVGFAKRAVKAVLPVLPLRTDPGWAAAMAMLDDAIEGREVTANHLAAAWKSPTSNFHRWNVYQTIRIFVDNSDSDFGDRPLGPPTQYTAANRADCLGRLLGGERVEAEAVAALRAEFTLEEVLAAARATVAAEAAS